MELLCGHATDTVLDVQGHHAGGGYMLVKSFSVIKNRSAWRFTSFDESEREHFLFAQFL